MSFFEASKTASRGAPPSLLPRCGACGLYRTCESPKMPVTGDGRRGILVVAEAPGEEEDACGVQLVGQAGRLLRRVLEDCDVDLDRDCWKTNALICRPPKNRPPTADEIDYCRPNLIKAINELKPKKIILLGAAAVRSLISPLWKEDVGRVSQWIGWQIPLQRYNAWVCPANHPSYVLRTEGDRDGRVIRLWFERHIRQAVELVDRPWEDVPDYKKQVKVVLDHREAAAWLRRVVSAGGPVAFDYETNRLKPDAENARIYSCAVCWRGKQTIAYPWVGDAVAATGELLRSRLPKIGANNKFEERWTRKVFGHGVENWVWDTMLSAHHLDCRDGITSVKFQALVRLGQEDWSWALRPYLSDAGTGDGLNRIHQADLRSLLIYNGIDALVEYLIADQQKKEMLG